MLRKWEYIRIPTIPTIWGEPRSRKSDGVNTQPPPLRRMRLEICSLSTRHSFSWNSVKIISSFF
jgi:hypothetical protein